MNLVNWNKFDSENSCQRNEIDLRYDGCIKLETIITGEEDLQSDLIVGLRNGSSGDCIYKYVERRADAD
jgi:hypothetical protein